jgi:hypothetical protein
LKALNNKKQKKKQLCAKCTQRRAIRETQNSPSFLPSIPVSSKEIKIGGAPLRFAPPNKILILPPNLLQKRKCKLQQKTHNHSQQNREINRVSNPNPEN